MSNIIFNKNNSKVYMDLSITSKWIRHGVMIGIVRTCVELLSSLSKLVEVIVVEVVSVDGIPTMRKLNKSTFEPTLETIVPVKGDILITPELQVRGVHVPMEHPEVNYFKKNGVMNYAIIHDILPLYFPDHFESDTVKGMPDYLVNIFRNYDKIICVSKSVADTINDYIQNGIIAPFDLKLGIGNPSEFYKYMTSGWYNIEHDCVWTSNNAKLSVYISNVNTDFTIRIKCKSLRGVGDTVIRLNGDVIGVIHENENSRHYTFNIPSDLINPLGLQMLQFITNGAYSPVSRDISADNRILGIAVESIEIHAVDRSNVQVFELLNKDLDVGFAHWGVTELTKEIKDAPDPVLVNLIKRNQFDTFLMVGTIEPRKGYEIILRVFEKLWSNGYRGKLCLVGRVGWKMNEFVDRIRSNQRFGHNLFFLEAASDATLDYAYKHANALIQASAGEGFGLPLIEAGNYNIPILCSDIPVFHEVAGENALFFDRDNDEDIIDCIINFEKKKKAGQIPASKNIPSITWEECAQIYLEYFENNREYSYKFSKAVAKINNNLRTDRKKIVVTMTFPVFPPQGGGQARVFGLYKKLAKEYDIEIIALSHVNDFKRRQTIAPGLIEYVIPKSEEHNNAENELTAKTKVPITDIGMMLFNDLTPEYSSALKQAGKDAEYIVLCHPYTYAMVKEYFPDKIIIYEAQDVEFQIKKEMLEENSENNIILNKLYSIEKKCCLDAEYIMTCSDVDKKELSKLYKVDKEKIIVVPNGVDCDEIKFVSNEERKQQKEKKNLTGLKVGVFMGSWHKPNLDAGLRVIEIATLCPNVVFLLMGSQCDYFKDYALPPNIGLLGLVSDKEKDDVFSSVDFALNPMESGSGTNLKMFDYMARGIPIFTTEFGTRGIEDKDLFHVCSISEMPEKIKEFSLDENTDLVEKSRKYVEENFDWLVIADIVFKKMKDKLH